MWMGLSKRVSLCSMWMSTKERPEQRRILIIRWKKWPILWTLVSPCLQIPLFSPVGSTSSNGDRERDDICPQQHGLLLTMAVATAKSPTCQQNRPTLSLWFVATFQGNQAVLWWQVDYTGPHPSWKRQHFILIEINTLPVNLPPLLAELLEKSTMHGFIERFIHWHGSHTALLLSEQLILQKIGCAHGTQWSCYYVPQPRGAGLIGRWNVLLKTQWAYPVV